MSVMFEPEYWKKENFVCPKCGYYGEPSDESFDSIDGGIRNFNYVCVKCDDGGTIPYNKQP